MRINGRVVVITTEVEELRCQGFGSLETAEGMRTILATHWREVHLMVLLLKMEVMFIIVLN